jgi:sigma-54 dependent transcriptional regulator, acetoin dehydrogenase operon transcriptional activator AcoR
MSTQPLEPAATPTVPMRGQQAWRRTLEARERFLADPDGLPPGEFGVRREIVMSWRRSLLSGVDATSTDLPRDAGAVPPERLIQAARPVLDRLADEIAGAQAWAFLADRECRLVSHVAGDRALTPMLEDRGAFPGALFGEDVVGTNGLGTAVEQQRPFIVAGSEHFRAHESDATTCGAPVRDPLTGRLAGLLNMNCPYHLTSPLMLPFVTGLAREIEARLRAACSADEQPLLDEVARMWKRRTQAVVVLSEEVFVANAAALTLLNGHDVNGAIAGADYELLRDLTREACAQGRERTARLTLGPDLVVTVRCRPLSGTSRPAGVITLPVRAAAAAHRAVPGTSPRSSSSASAMATGERLLAELAQARAARRPVLIRGERGTGKITLARRTNDRAASAGRFTVVDCALGGIGPQSWASQLAAAVADPAATIVVQHLDALDPALVPPVAGLIASARAWLVATASPDLADEHAGVTERFDVIMDVPPLRDRAAEIPGLVAEIIAQLRPQPSRPRCTPEALTALAGSPWPGNVRQLRQVLATALTRSMSCDITIDDLPGGYAGAARSRRHTGLERAEREALVTALRAAGWDREAAARDLGISRATIYRKLKRHNISPPPPVHGGTAMRSVTWKDAG